MVKQDPAFAMKDMMRLIEQALVIADQKDLSLVAIFLEDALAAAQIEVIGTADRLYLSL